MSKEYEEIKFPKGAAAAICESMNSAMTGGKPKKVNANGTKKKTGTKPKATAKKK